MNLINLLNRMGSAVRSEEPNINRGGCCVFASRAAQLLEFLGIPARVFTTDWAADGRKVSVDHARKEVKHPNRPNSWGEHGVYFCHVGVEFDYEGRTYHYDVDGCRVVKKVNRPKFKGIPIYTGRLSTKEAYDLAQWARGWNTMFPRKGGIERVEEVMASYARQLG